MVVIADVFPKLQTVNKFVRRLCENPRFGTCFDSQHVKVSQILAKCPFLVILSCFFIFLMEVDLEMSPLVLAKILRVFLSPLTADGKYPLQDCEKLLLPIQMQLSEKLKTFS